KTSPAPCASSALRTACAAFNLAGRTSLFALDPLPAGLVANGHVDLYDRQRSEQFSRDRRGWNHLFRFVRRSIVRGAIQRIELLELPRRRTNCFGTRLGLGRDGLLWSGRWIALRRASRSRKRLRQVEVALPDG